MEIRLKIIVIAILSLACSLPFAWYLLVGGEEYAILFIGILCFTSLFYYAHRGIVKVRLDKIDILFVCFALYRLFNACTPLDIVVFSHTSSMIGLWFFFRNLPRNRFLTSAVLWAIVLSSALQAVIAIMQCLGVINGFHAFFPVTGTFGNPGPLGGYLALGLCSLFPMLTFKSQSRCQQVLVAICAFLLLCGICIADSRASWVAVGASICVCVLQWWRVSSPKKTVLFVLGLILLGFSLIWYRPESVIARLTIWRVSRSMFGDAPVFGNGTGSFLRTYMDKQAEYLSNQNLYLRKEADDVGVAYNEFIEILVEQGFVGFVLLIVFIICVWKILWKKNVDEHKHCFLYPLICILVFSLFSYPSSVLAFYIPVVVMLAMMSSCKGRQISKLPVCLFVFQNLVFLVFCFCCNLSFWNHLSKYVNLEAKPMDVSECKPIPWFVRHNSICLCSIADAQIMVGDHAETVNTCRRLVLYRNESQWYMALGDAYAQLRQVEEADKCYEQVSTMRPGLMEPFFARFLMWVDVDEKRAIPFALHLLEMPVKIENTSTKAMRKSVGIFLREKGISSTTI